MRQLSVLLLLIVACASTVCTGAAQGSQSRHRHSHRRRLRETLPLLPRGFISDPEARSPGQVFYNTYSLALGDGRNFTFAQPGYVASTGFTVNATLDGSVSPGQIQLYCAPGAAQAQNKSAPLPGVASALGATSYSSMSAVLDVSTNHTNPFSSGSMFRRTGLEGDGVSYTDEGIAYSDPITCVVQYGNTTNAPSSNGTYLGVRLTLAVHYPQPALAPSEQAAIRNIFTQCCNSTDSCRAWKQVNRNSNSTNKASINFCSVPGVIPANVSYQIPVLRLQNNWFQEVPRSWYGTADRAAFWFLTDLRIQGNILTGPFPDGLARPSSTRKRTMTYLDISDNNLSGPLPKATNATAPFFRDLWYFNASFNNLSGPIPEDFSRALIFNASAGFSWAAGFLGRAEALAVARQFAFDVSNNSLSGDLPGFLASSRLPKYLNASSLQLKGNHFSCSSAQDKGYLNLTSCAQAAGSAQAQGSSAADPGQAGLGKGAIAGIVVGALAALALVGGVLAYALRRRRSMQGWQKEALDGQHIAPKQGPGVELTNSSALA